MNDLQPLHTFGLTAHCQTLLYIDSLDAIPIGQQSEPFWLLGEGSNCIFVDDFHGSVWLNQLRGIDLSETNTDFIVRVASGENWHAFLLYCLEHGIYGMENLALIPGTVGAAPIQNIGAYGLEVSQFIQSVDVIDLITGEQFVLSNEECLFDYRESIFKQPQASHWMITAVTFSVTKDYTAVTTYGELKALANPTPESVFAKVVEIRQSKLPDPVVVGNAGSFFKNPIITHEHYTRLQQQYADIPAYPVNVQHVKVPAAWLIDQAGYKGQRLGGIQCHTKQPLVLTNAEHGSGAELLAFARQIQQTVKERFGIELQNEVRLVGAQGLVRL
ncbi:UDP-N-acetylmuramate dehydrogenase [Alteromonas sp. ASW11-36]|uniref:UDP-N-acetylenolpyruvoylglucosamine reductase n=1 Tax=Alteromonas arenosi TaxID=3055817 RepID=A0ABT7SYY9_9ALTE|nr:UDP-N-acetylmuramate dehydrogenase [Alteromonas sp. ASW11-36]MDM7861416.1 UDP-N-acetylmuramate dehydrogenase [Alteromonas sp. ASW11-36]